MKNKAVASLSTLIASCVVSACSQAPLDQPISAPIAQVTTAVVISGDLPEVVSAFGTVALEPNGQRSLHAEIEARVLELTKAPGDTVEAGELVLRLGPSSSTDVDIARTKRDSVTAQAAAARAQRLRADGLASDADVEAATTAAKDLASLSTSLSQRAKSIADLRSPIVGVVDAIFVEPGDLVAPGVQLARLVSPHAIEAKIAVEIEDVARLKSGDPVQLRALDNAGAAISGTIRMIDFRLDPATRMASIFVPVNPGQGLLAGEAVRATITAEVHRDALMVPRQSVFTDEQGSFVYLNDNGKAALRRIEVGITSGAQTVVASGLAAGDVVIVEGAAVLATGMRVTEVKVAPRIAQ